jgi:sigma-E factor negative regulatory protein RseB
VKRITVSTGPIAVLGPLALLSLFLLPLSDERPPPSDDGRLTSSSGVSETVAAVRAPTSDPRALRLLDRASTAPTQVSYRGVQFVSAWTAKGSTGLVVDVVHRPGVGTTVKLPATAWTPAEQTHLAATGAEPSLLGGAATLSLLASHYALSTARPESVAGRAVDVVVATPPGATSPAARFWLDRKTGLVLRREVYDESGRITRASAFVEITVGESNNYADAAASSKDTDRPKAWPDAIDSAALQRMRDRGWQCPDVLPPSLRLVDARRGGGNYGGIVHLSYSDGLASVSVFEQRGRLRVSDLTDYRTTSVGGRKVYLRDGVPQRLVWASDGTVYTVVADASARTVGDVVGALPRPSDDTGAWHRLDRGLNRVASWFNPFG